MAAIGPDFVALQVRDLDVSTRFYTERLGLTPAPAGPPGAVVFTTEPIPFAIREPAVDLDATSRLGWGVALWPMTSTSCMTTWSSTRYRL
jgi:catechol 2,3-dioxygenase-like lactoylglutathione lyase family enzyme